MCLYIARAPYAFVLRSSFSSRTPPVALIWVNFGLVFRFKTLLAFSNMTRACVGENRLHLNRSRVRRVHMATLAGGRGRRMKLISRGNIIC